MDNKWLDFLQQMEAKQMKEMHDDWVKQKYNNRLNKKIDDVQKNLREEDKHEDK